MEELKSKLLEVIDKLSAGTEISSKDLAVQLEVDHQKVVGAIKSVQAAGDILSCRDELLSQLELTTEGAQIAESGSYEALLFQAVDSAEGTLHAELMAKVANSKLGFSKAIANKWIKLDKGHASGPRVFRTVESVEDSVHKLLCRVKEGDSESLAAGEKADLKKRKLVQECKLTVYHVSRGPNFTLTLTKDETELTAEMIATGSWRQVNFKPYNFDALGISPSSGHLHPLLKVRSEFRQIFLEMGFQEMSSFQYVESSFWNFDALFQPQQHPARDAHDTFFISDPQLCNIEERDYLERVKTVHSKGGYGSIGYNVEWKEEEARKNILRTHTTGVSARMLYHLGQQKEFEPGKYFCIDRVFRNETLDATHLAEFHQIEGMVVDYDLNLTHLMGMIKEFYRKLGIAKLRFKPAYNPYTEPSMEIFSYHEGLAKWVEIGNSGVFRPEMLLPMGLPPRVSVIAWGLSVERPTMIKYGINNIRDLIGPKVDLSMVQKNPICRLDR